MYKNNKIMDLTFINCLLALCLLAILLVFFSQTINKSTNQKTLSTRKNTTAEQFLPVIFDTCPMLRKEGMPVHRVGPVYNFHQHFNKYRANLQTESCPTGIPEMGWRNLFLSQYGKNMIDYSDTTFQDIPTRHFLDNMDSVDNIYRKCL
jgi:hypothetical protein